jgi:hypothetical protein
VHRGRIVFAACVIGGLIGVVAAVIGGVAGLLVALAGLAALPFAFRPYLRRRFPALVLESAAQALDPSARPPDGAEPAALPVAGRLVAANAAGDWDALEATLADDFAYSSPQREKPLTRRAYVWSLRYRHGAFAESETRVVEAFADPDAREVYWVRIAQSARSPHHPPIALTRLERWTLAPGDERVREIALVAVTELH